MALVAPQTILDIGRSQFGKRYVYGAAPAISNPNPAAFDCSGYVHWVYGRAGINLPPPSDNQFHLSTPIDLDQARATAGALLVRPGADAFGHVAISDGKGGTLEARGKAYGVGSWSSLIGRTFSVGGLVPGVDYFAGLVDWGPPDTEDDLMSDVLTPDDSEPNPGTNFWPQYALDRKAKTLAATHGATLRNPTGMFGAIPFIDLKPDIKGTIQGFDFTPKQDGIIVTEFESKNTYTYWR